MSSEPEPEPEPTTPAPKTDIDEYAKILDEIDEAHKNFLIKHLARVWPRRAVRLVGIMQILLALAILGVDLPIILMFAPRWQVFAGCWTFLVALITGIFTVRSATRTTWLKVKWTVGINVICALAAGVMVSFDTLYAINPYICINIGPCNYLWYTYLASNSYYVAQIVLGCALLLTAFLMIVFFIIYGIGGSTLFENIQKGTADPLRRPLLQSQQPPVEMFPPPNAPMPFPGGYPPGPMMMMRPPFGAPPQPFAPMRPMGGRGMGAVVPAPHPAMFMGPRPPMMFMGPPAPMPESVA